MIPDAKLILVSFAQYGLFFTFATDSGTWTRVLTDTDKTRSQRYLPILHRAIYVQHHKAVYFLMDNAIYAYKLTYQKDDQGGMQQQLKLDLPVLIDFVCPFKSDHGYGLLTRLSSHLMCAVWISLASYDKCPCHNLHAIVTTFYLHDAQDPAQGGIKVLHSTYRRLDMAPNPAANQQFCFLQEYEDQGSVALQQRGEEEEGLTCSQQVEHPSKMLSCCRRMMKMRSTPPSGPSRTLQVDPPSRQQVCSSSHAVPVKPATTTTIKKDLIIICQAGSRSVIYQTGAMDDDVKPLEPCYAADVGDHDWHFFQSGSKIHAVSSIRASMLEFSLNKDRKTFERPVRRPSAAPLVEKRHISFTTVGAPAVDRIHDRTSNQTVLEKEQPVRMCAIVSTDWSHSGHLVAWGNPRHARRSLVQHLSRQSSQMKNFTLGDAQD
ncbi:uncharacterized protein [Lolium perenne]|uniref:uncharacterized protein n=1 Tax=Lolium perenne TaxID=4522 RepID=UPI003A994F7C